LPNYKFLFTKFFFILVLSTTLIHQLSNHHVHHSMDLGYHNVTQSSCYRLQQQVDGWFNSLPIILYCCRPQ